MYLCATLYITINRVYTEGRGPRDIPPDIYPPKFDNYMYTKHKYIRIQFHFFTFREPLPNKTQQQNQRKAEQTIHVEKYIEYNSPPGKKMFIKPLSMSIMQYYSLSFVHINTQCTMENIIYQVTALLRAVVIIIIVGG